MKVLYFDCFSGISGDMTLGALLDLGIDKDEFLNELKKLNLSGYEIEINKANNYGITGMDVNVVINEEYNKMVNKLGNHISGCNGAHTHGRHLKDIEEIINNSNLKYSVKELSKKIFREIARVESKVHNKSINEIHFHEVGAVDSIVDIVGAAICFDLLKADKVISSPVHDGQGFIECEHGTMPVPVPAVMEMLKDSKIPFVCEDVSTELVTPTGLGILKCTASYYGNMPEMFIDKVGYGMGKRNIGKLNALRAVIGTLPDEDRLSREDVTLFETNIDDMTSEMMGFTMDKLIKAGALDVFCSPIYMKKNRPAYKLSVLSKKDTDEDIVKILFEETTTLGIRKIPNDRIIMDREVVSINTEYGNIRVKVGSRKGFKKFSPEYEDCKLAANEYNEPLWKVYNTVNKNMGNIL
jgi:uncharacterized protein (TIGR00299 family) protein